LHPLQGVQASKISPRESRHTRHHSANRPNRAARSPLAAAGDGTHPPAAENPKVECPLEGVLRSKISGSWRGAAG